MTYKLMLFVAFIGVLLYFFGYMQKSMWLQVGDIALTGSMFAVFMARKLQRR